MYTGLEIAIVGMSGRFPGARNVDMFWQNVRNGVESITRLSDDDLRAAGIDAATLRDPNYVKAAPILDDIELFDAAFFGINPREAEITDPQHRFFLECAWEALEHAGYDPLSYPGAIGLYGGVATNTYWLFTLYRHRHALQTVGSHQILIGTEKDHLTTRVAYKLNLRGPAVTVQTSCSTSLVAVHLACQALLNGECDLALAGGVAINVLQKLGYFYEQGDIVSPYGSCCAFGADAAGTIFGSGVGMVVLKPLTDALNDGDTIHAIIKGSAIKNDGVLRVGYTAPGVDGQASVIGEALAVAKVDPATISYVEAHGTGTNLGDTIEIAALNQVFGQAVGQNHRCALGSVKTNIGHLNSAAGVAGLIKTVMALKHQLLPPTLHAETPHPQLDLTEGPFYLNTRATPWPAGATPRRAGVSSFGIGGTNAHAVLEAAPPLEAGSPSRPWQMLLLSARSEAALEHMTTQLAGALREQPELDLADVAHTLQVGRHPFSHRRMLVCRDRQDAAETLDSRDPHRVLTHVHEPAERTIALMFPAQSATYARTAQALYPVEPVFREQLDRCAELLRPHLGRDIRPLLFDDGQATTDDRRPTTEGGGAGGGRWSVVGGQLEQTQYAQPALFAVEYALAQLWIGWGIRPAALIGQGCGEYVAACLAGVFSLEDALALVAARGRLVSQLPHEAALATAPMALLEPFMAQLRGVRLRQPALPLISSVTGTWITAAEASSAAYWERQLRQAVRLGPGVEELLRLPNRIVLEVGSGDALSSLIHRQENGTSGVMLLPALGSAADQQSEVERTLTMLGQLWMAGADIDWAGFYRDEQRRRVPLPTYPFERQRFWLEPHPELLQQGHQHQEPDAPATPAVAAPSLHPRPNLLNSYVAPRDELEARLTAIWQDFLGIDPIGVYDNFFELGGHSLLASRLIAQASATLDVDLTLQDLLADPTVATMALVVTQLRARTPALPFDEPQRQLLLRDELPLNIDELSDDEVDRLLSTMLESKESLE